MKLSYNQYQDYELNVTNGKINVDVVNKETEEVDYYFNIDQEKLIEFIVKYQEENNII